MSNNTEEQTAAIYDNNRFLGILASAGSGKTRTLVQRIAREIAELDSSPSELIAFTFTNRAADDLKTKVYQEIRKRTTLAQFSEMFVGTIHEYCNQFLKQLDDYRNFDVLDELQLESMTYRLHDELRLDKVYGYSIGGNIQAFIRDYEVYENELLDFSDLPKKIDECIRQFCNILHSNRLLTFGSMIRYACQEIEKQGGLDQLKHLFVDEYQDINPAQDRLIKTMVKKGSRLTVVGDDLQSIYQWRGSDVLRIIDFKKEWDGETHILSLNFRSRKDIVEAADRFSKTIEPRFKEKNKSMIPTVDDRKNGQNICWIQSKTEEEQNSCLLRILEKALQSGYSPSEIAILLRSVKRSGQPIITELNKRHIPVFCPQISVVETSLINKMFVPLFRLFSLREARNGKEELEHDELFSRFITSFYELQPDEDSRSQGLEITTEWAQAVRLGQANAYNIRSWLYRFFNAASLRWAFEDVNALMQIGLLTRIIRSAEETNRRNLKGIRRKNVRDVYAHLSYMLENSEEESISTDSNSIKNVDAVFLSTVHQAKGLEFPVVIIPSISYRRFPIRPRRHQTSFSDKVASRYGTTDSDERRLFYVALTRAKDHLILQGFMNDGRYSPFLSDDGEHNLVEPAESPSRVEFYKNRSAKRKTDEIISIGISDLIMMMECPFQYYLRRIFGIYPAVGDELGYGRSLHEIIQRSIEKGKWKSSGEIKNIVEQFTHIPLEGERQQNIHKAAIEERVNGLSKIKELTNIKDIEIPTRFYIGDVEVIGTVDTYTQNDVGEITLIDWKTSISDEFVSRYEKQLQLYAHALREQNMTVVGANIIDVNQSSTFQRVIKRDVQVDSASETRILTEVARELKRLRSLKFDPYPSHESCKICDINRICRYSVERA